MGINNILKEHYKLQLNSVSRLEGYGSTNYKVEAKEGNFILKIYQNSIRIKKELLAEERVLLQLNTLKINSFPKGITTTSGEVFVEESGNIYRLLTFVEGSFLGEVPHTPALMESFGSFLGKMDLKLITHQEEVFEAREIPWDLRHLHLSKPLLQFIPNPSDRNLVSYFMLQFREHLVPFADQFRKSLIHNDGNDWNVLTDRNKVTGIIDFGDMCHTWLVNEVAIGMTYAMMQKDLPMVSGLKVLKGYHRQLPLTESECDSLYYLIAARLCISVCQSAFNSRENPQSEYITISEKGAWKLLYQWLRISPIHAKRKIRGVCGFPNTTPVTGTALLEHRQKHFGKNLSLSYKNPIHMVGAAFQYMYDAEGNTFLDAYNNIMLVGHCHPHVVEAGQKAMATLNTNTRYIYNALRNYSDALLRRFPEPLNKVYFVNSGSEATDLAIRMARAHTLKKKIMVLEHGYHGHTQAGMEISSYKYSADTGNGKPEDTLQTPIPKVYGSSWENDGSAGAAYAQNALELIEKHSGSIAAFIAEPIVGCGGQVPLAKGYLNAIYPAIREQGGICISDEVQVGFGRLGEVFWGFELYDVIPDIVVIGKPMGNGHPMGAVITTSKIASSFEKGPEFFSSFGGNPVSCAIGLAVLEVIENEKKQEHALQTGEYLKKKLQALQIKHKTIGDVRGHGLFLGMEMIDEKGQPNTKLAGFLKNRLREQFILVGTDGPYDNVMKIKPPLAFNTSDVDELVAQIDTILS
ncbi:aminotransferase class III-fold pyridoxal phosphate-dependent enzyme [Muriicola sp. E247]|uniref:aminotransferase class III-fold pyridoxal phosphate-dependent enzyme n=1 Tax=Muriicola sp. E247 TaxID=3242730 RepID=UPI0035263664